MRNRTLNVFIILGLLLLTSCTPSNKTVISSETESKSANKEPHSYGGWYCPDNLNGFPAVDIADWKNVPVVNGRMATLEEAQNGTSLIFVDAEKYPDAKALDLTMPKLASIYNYSAQREDLIIVIQAINVDHDSIVGFRYLNGGNGSARINEVRFIDDNEVALSPTARFVSHTIQIKAKQTTIWDIITKVEHAETLHPYFDQNNQLENNWRENTNVNFQYQNSGDQTAAYADILFGCYYVQNDFEDMGYTEKFLLIENEETGKTEFKIVCGPFAEDFETQRNALINWGEKVKQLSEKGD